MSYIILDKELDVRGVLDLNGQGCKFYDDLRSTKLADDQGKIWSDTLEISVPYGFHEADYITQGHHLLKEASDGYTYCYRIYNWVDDAVGSTHVKKALGINLLAWELSHKIVPAKTYTSATSQELFEYALQGSGWEINVNTFSGGTTSTEFTAGQNAMYWFDQLISSFNVEIRAYVQVYNGKIIRKLIDIVEELGESNGYRLEYSRDLLGLTRTGYDTQLYTKLYVYGGTADGASTPTSIASVNNGSDFILDDEANDKYNNGEPHLEGYISNDSLTTPAALLAWGKAQLELYNHPRYAYNVDVAHLGYVPNLGDHFQVVDFSMSPELTISARAIQLDESEANPTNNKIIVGEFVDIVAVTPSDIWKLRAKAEDQAKKLDQAMLDLQTKTTLFRQDTMPTTAKDGDFWIYTGTDASYPKIQQKRDTVWVIANELKGDQGTPGTPGTDGLTPYMHIAYADDATGNGFSQDPTGKAYIGTYVNFSQNDSTISTDYTWAKIQGPQGPQGPAGIDGLQGPKGDQGIQGPNGTSSYTHIAYANSSDGTVDFSVGDSVGKNYIGMYVDNNITDSTVPSKYKWSLIKGEKGDQGIQGPTGPDGKTPYFHTAYATNSSGTAGFSVSDSVGKTYIGTYTDFTATDSNNPADYKWTLIKGDKGDSAVMGILSNDAQTIPTDSAGNNGIYTGANTTLYVYLGSVDDSANWSFGASASSGVTGSLSGKTYTVTNLTTDTGYVDITATRTGYASVTRRFSLSKSKQGSSATAYWLVNSVPAIQRNLSGVYTPSTITVTGKSQTGSGSPVDYAARFVIAETTDGTTYTDKYTSSANETSKTYTPSAGIKALRIRMYLAGGTTSLLDEQIVSVVSDGPIGPQGDATYLWVKYADDANGNGMSDIPDGKRYLGMAYNKTSQNESTLASDYSWSPLYDNVVIGGKNLLTKTDVSLFGTGDFVSNGSPISVDTSLTYLGKPTIKIDMTTSASGMDYNAYVKLKRNTVYTYGMMMYSTTAATIAKGNPLHMWLGTTEASNHLETIQSVYPTSIAANTWTMVYTVFKTPDTADVYYWKPFVYNGFSVGSVVNVCEIQCEEGNVRSAWTMAYDDLFTSVQVGGRNYIRNSNFWNGTTGYNTVGNHSVSLETTDKYNGNNALKLVSTGVGSSSAGLVATSVIDGIINGQKYTLTFYAKSVSGNTSLHTELWGGLGSRNLTLSTSWQKYTVVLTGSTTAQSLYFWLLGAGTALITMIKLETGNVASEWSQAVEDVQDQLDDIASDDKLTPNEKIIVQKDWSIIVAEKPTLDNQGVTFGITTEKDGYDNAYLALSTYLSPLLSDLTTTSSITGATLRDNFKAYYDKKALLQKAITDAAKDYTDSSVSNIKLGGVNLLPHTNQTFTSSLTGNTFSSMTGNLFDSFTREGQGLALVNNQTYTISFDYSISNYVSGVGFGLGSGVNIGSYDIDDFASTEPYSKYGGASGRVEFTFTYKTATTRYLAFRPMRISSGNDTTTMTINITNLKVEKGNKSTGYSKALEDTPQPNLVTNSDDFSKFGTFANNGGSVVTLTKNATTFRGKSTWNIANTGDGDHGIKRTIDGLTTGKWYTVSMWYKIPAPAAGVTYGYGNGFLFVVNKANNVGIASANPPITNNSWQKISVSGKCTDDGFTIRVDSGNVPSIDVSFLKIEEGMIASDWIPSYSDIENQLLDMTSDSKLTPTEKSIVKKDWDAIVAEKPTLDSQATTYGITTEKTNYGSAYDTLNTYITPLLSNLSVTSDITGTTLRDNFKAYYDKKALLQKAVSDASKTYTDNGINNVQIGGRNLARNTDFRFDFTNWNGWGAPSERTVVSINDLTGFSKAFKVTTTGNNQGVLQSITVKPSTSYALSYYIKSDGTATGYVQMEINNGSGGASRYFATLDGTATWKKITVYVTTNSTDTRITLQVGKGGNGVTGTLYFTGIMLEESNKASAWSLSPEDIQDTVDNVKIGGTQLYLNSANFGYGWNSNNMANRASSIDVPIINSPVSSVTWNVGTGTGTVAGIYQRFRNDNGNTKFINGQQYTISIWAKASANVNLTINVENITGASIICPLTTSWQRFTYTFTGNGSGHTITYYIDDSTKVITAYLCMPMLVTGNKAMDWAPAPEDAFAVTGVLSNDTQTLPADSSGTVSSFTGASTTMSIYVGATDDSSNWSVTAGAGSGVTGSLSGKTYTVTGLSVDSSYVDLTATRTGYPSVTKRFTLTKAKQGVQGNTVNGAPATAYWLVNNAPAIQKNTSGVYTPSNITATSMAQTGTGTPAVYAGRFVIAESTDGTNYTDKYVSSANESVKTYTPSAGIKAVRVRMYLAGGTTTLLDEQVVPVVSDGSDGSKGDKGDPGNAGKGVSSIVEQYYMSTSNTTQTGGTWSTTVPTWVDGQYMWTRSVITYTDSTSTTTSPVCVTGSKGQTGGTGGTGPQGPDGEDSITGYFTNPYFKDWTGTVPNTFGVWNTAPTKETTITKRGIGARFTVTAVADNRGMVMPSFTPPTKSYYVIEYDVYVVSGTLGSAGFLVDVYSDGTNYTRLSFPLTTDITTVETGRWYSIRKIFEKPSAVSTVHHMSGYVMGNWGNNSLGNGAVKDIVYDYIQIREATMPEIYGYLTGDVVDAWKGQAVNGVTTINGGLLQNKSVLTEHLAIGDFTNYSQLNSNTLAQYGWTSVADASASNNPWFQRNGISRDNQISPSYECIGGESYRIDAEISSTVTGATTSGGAGGTNMSVQIGIYGRTDTGGYTYQFSSGVVNTTGNVSGVVKLASNVVSFTIYVQVGGYSPFAGTLKVRNVRVIKMTDNVLIADGTVNASHINSLNGLNVGNGNFVIDANGNVTLKGTLNGATGSFAGDLSAQYLYVGSMAYGGVRITMDSAIGAAVFDLDPNGDLAISGKARGGDMATTRMANNLWLDYADLTHTNRLQATDITANGTLKIDASLSGNWSYNNGIELGSTGAASTPFIDFHSGATNVDYDARIIASGGSGANGGGTLNIIAANLQQNGIKIIDSSSNASGYYVKFSDGTLMMWQNNTVTSTTNTTFYTRDWTMPAAFVGSLAVTVSAYNNYAGATANNAAQTFALQNGTTWRIGVNFAGNIPNATTSIYISVFAIGRWK